MCAVQCVSLRLESVPPSSDERLMSAVGWRGLWKEVCYRWGWVISKRKYVSNQCRLGCCAVSRKLSILQPDLWYASTFQSSELELRVGEMSGGAPCRMAPQCPVLPTFLCGFTSWILPLYNSAAILGSLWYNIHRSTVCVLNSIFFLFH